VPGQDVVGRITERSVYLEVGQKRVFACYYEWPGWARAAKSEEQALETLASYSDRYGKVVRLAGVPFESARAAQFRVVETLPGSVTTDFGAPEARPEADWRPLTAAGAERLTGLVEAAWRYLDDVAAHAPSSLRKGPRGGGRDRDRIVDHVLEAEASYVRMLGLRMRAPSRTDRDAIEAFRREVGARLRSVRGAERVTQGRSWPPRYFARRMAWHVLDHAWEIEDRSD
jgi:hypothetical protein